MDDYLPTVGHNIIQLNEYAQLLVEALDVHGEETYDLLSNLFKAYKSASDQEFVKYIQSKQDDYDEGKDISPQTLMLLAANKYKIMVEDGIYNKPSEAEEKLLALEAQVEKLKRQQSRTKKPDNNKSPTSGDSNKSEESKDKRKGNGKSKHTPKPDWMTKPPNDSKKGKKKVMDGKDYWWCEPLQTWACHHPSECRAKNKVKDDKTLTNQNESAESRTLKLTQALQALVSSQSE